MNKFKAEIELIGINPYVLLPDKALKNIFKQAEKDKGPIRVHGTVNEKPFKQTLVRYLGEWRLYINTTMLKNSPKRIGETIYITITFDPEERTITANPKLLKALKDNPKAKAAFDLLTASRRHEIVRYIAHLKTEASVDKNIKRAIDFLEGKGRFVGRDKP